MMMTSVLLAGALLAFFTQDAAAIIVPWPGSKTKVAGNMLENACVGVTAGMTVCYPFKSNKYIKCQGAGKAGVAKTCPNNKIYDYYLRACLKKSEAKPCPAWPCPVHYACKNASDPSIAWPPCHFINAADTYNTMGVSPLIWPPITDRTPLGITAGPFNYTITLNQTGEVIYHDPTIARCQAGAWMKVTTLGKAPAGWTPKTYSVFWEAPTTNGMNYPVKISDLTGYIGDKVYIYWSGTGDFTYSGLAAFNPNAPDAAPVVPYPPQPLYSCPLWIAIRDDPQVGRVIPTLGNETRIHEVFSRPKSNGSTRNVSYPWVVTVTPDMDGGIFASPSPPSCRLGQVFRVTMATQSRAPKNFNITWELDSYQNFPDLEVVPGDTLSFNWFTASTGPSPYRADGFSIFQVLQASGISFLDSLYVNTSGRVWKLRETCRSEKNLNTTRYNLTALNLTSYETCNSCIQPRSS